MKSSKVRILNFSILSFLGIVLSVFGSLTNLYIPIFIGKMINFKEALQRSNELKELLFKLAMVLFITIFLTSIGSFLVSREGDKFVKNMREEINNHLLYMPISFFDEKISDELARRVVNDVTIIKNFTTNTIPSNISSGVTFIGTILLLIMIDWKFTLLVFISIPIYLIFMFPVGNVIELLSNQLQDELSKLLSTISENFRFIRSIKLNVAENQAQKNVESSTRALYRTSIKADVINSIISPLQSIASFGIIALIVIYGSVRVKTGSLSMSNLVVMIMYLFQLMGPLNVLSSFYTDYKQCKGSLRNINEIMIKTPEPYAVPVEIQDLTINNVKMSNVSFDYPGSGNNTLNNVDMIFRKGDKTAIVGPSGAGKTTIINLLTKLYPIKNGEIIIDGVSRSDSMTLQSWRSLFGVVSQENTVLSGTILDNLLFGLSYIPSIEDINNALEAVDLLTYIQNLPNKLETVVGEQGFKLSGGQRQRLQIARIYLRNPKILILDEATSSLDPYSEKIVTESLKKIMSEKVIIVIAHRLSTILDSDNIYFLDRSTVIGHGPHDALYNNLEEYKQFVDIQFKK